MHKKIKISIITVVYNGEKYLEKAIKSVLEQDYNNIEYVIVNGKSTDNTLSIIQKYRKHIDILISEKDNGIYDAMNKGIRISTGDVIYFLNSDDYLYSKDIISKVAKVFNKNSYQLVYGNILQHDTTTKKNHKGHGELNLKDIQQGQRPPHQAAFVTRNLLEKYGGFNTEYKMVADYDLFCRIFKNNYREIIYINEIIANYNLHGYSSEYIKRFRDSAKVILANFGIFKYILWYKRNLIRLIKYYIKKQLTHIGMSVIYDKIKKKICK